jgi:hypothetical protein
MGNHGTVRVLEGKGGYHSDPPSTDSSRWKGDEGLVCVGVDGDCVIAVGRSLWHSDDETQWRQWSRSLTGVVSMSLRCAMVMEIQSNAMQPSSLILIPHCVSPCD